MSENPVFPEKHAPSLYVQNEKEDLSTKAALALTKARDRFVIRITGGCGNMDGADTEGMLDMYATAFGSHYGGAVLFGGTQMRYIDDFERIFPGITEVGPIIRKQCPDARVLGVVPKTGDLSVCARGVVVTTEPPLVTIVHPEQDVCIIVQTSVDDVAPWDAERLLCQRIVDYLQRYAGFKSLLISYNGGGVTGREVGAWVLRRWPVMLMKGSGRITDEMIDEYHEYDGPESLAGPPNVMVVPCTPAAMREGLIEAGALDKKHLPAEIFSFPKAT